MKCQNLFSGKKKKKKGKYFKMSSAEFLPRVLSIKAGYGWFSNGTSQFFNHKIEFVCKNYFKPHQK